jgi:two-component system chemotaxis response regulator CheB
MIMIPETKIRVLVVDDSAFMRSALKGMIGSDPDLQVIATARDGAEAIEKIAKLRPDIVTLDLEMPRMDGLSALKIIMEQMPLPVLIVSSLTTDGADMTFNALNLGAVDFICKDLSGTSLSIMDIQTALISKIKTIAGKKMKTRAAGAGTAVVPVMPQFDAFHTHNTAVVALGASTGGPKALQSVIPFLPKDFLVPVLVVQHMPALFTRSFAERLNAESQLEVKEAEDGDLLEPGRVFIARGGIHMKAKRTKPLEVRLQLDMHPDNLLYRPSVNVMMKSAVEAYGGRVLGVIMTGMGDDGTEGMKAIKHAGGKTIAQDEFTCVVWGMPRSAYEAGVVDKVATLTQIANEIVNMV